MPDFRIEAQFSGPVCGIDEAGRGPWAGPVVAAAAILDPARLPPGIDDSKKLTAARREALFAAVLASASIGIGAASVAEIERLNILGATLLAMRRAVAALPVRPAHALVDGKHCPQLACPATAVVDGDALSLSIAAASIVAKVIRDRAMTRLDSRYPAYAWAANKGYGTAAHQAGLRAAGISPHHRLGFAPLRRLLTQDVVIADDESMLTS
ncbi:ribonuclease HII [Ferrovibrio xuzhouensis]|uniref:Ribonuclease HII n=1 Tax=Ferrovibrio xuzhouensis TaxID=1576914 RepID=A0ABV7VIC0_9PROT